MSDNIKYIDVDSEEFENAPKALRDQVKKLQAGLTAEKQRADGLQRQVASHALADVLTGFKNPKRVEKDLLSDDVDPTDKAAVEAWLSENGDDYGRAEAPVESSEVPSGKPSVDEATQAAYRDLQGVQSLQRQSSDLSPLDKAKAEITPEMSPQEVYDVLVKNGN